MAPRQPPMEKGASPLLEPPTPEGLLVSDRGRRGPSVKSPARKPYPQRDLFPETLAEERARRRQSGSPLHGSEKRARTTHITVRLSEAERGAIDWAAERARLTTGSYVRRILLGAPPPRQVRRPSIDRVELVRLLGQIGHVGSNINQIAHAFNAGTPPTAGALYDALSDLKTVRDAVMSALGRAP